MLAVAFIAEATIDIVSDEMFCNDRGVIGSAFVDERRGSNQFDWKSNKEMTRMARRREQ